MTDTQPRRRPIRSGPLAIAFGVAALVLAACGSAPTPSTPPASDPPVASPSAPSGQDVVVDLETVGGGPVRAVVRDSTGRVSGASTGSPADGVSVDFDDVRVESIDGDSIRLTWSDYPAPNEYTVLVSSGEGGQISIAITRPEPSGATDSIALDRVLVLDFSDAVSPADVVASIG